VVSGPLDAQREVHIDETALAVDMEFLVRTARRLLDTP
jgi:hypothetical protein